jgi:hypothetical protein
VLIISSIKGICINHQNQRIRCHGKSQEIGLSKIHECTIQILRENGRTEEEIFETIAVTALFNFMDRMADALGAPVEGFQEMMQQMNDT